MSPYRAPHPCAHAGCPRVTTKRYCEVHQDDDKRARREHDQRRGSSTERGYGSRWQRYRASFLASNPLCVECARHGLLVQATVVDHITPHKGDQTLFWDPANHQALCKPCHDIKTAKEDGGFGHIK